MAPDPVRVALYERLTGDETLVGLLSAAGEIHHAKAPAGSEPPYAIFNKQAGTDLWVFGPSSERAVWLVKGVCRGLKADPAEAIDARCRELLDRTKLAVPDGKFTILRESDVRYGEPSDGEEWWHVGSLYRVFHP